MSVLSVLSSLLIIVVSLTLSTRLTDNTLPAGHDSRVYRCAFPTAQAYLDTRVVLPKPQSLLLTDNGSFNGTLGNIWEGYGQC